MESGVATGTSSFKVGPIAIAVVGGKYCVNSDRQPTLSSTPEVYLCPNLQHTVLVYSSDVAFNM